MSTTRTQFTISFSGLCNLDPRHFFADEGHTDATAEECAEAVRAYIADRGIDNFIDEWNLGRDLKVSVESRQVWP